MNDKLNNNVTILPPFKKFCMTIGELPTSYVESMTYYESLVWLCNYLSKTVIPAINTNSEAVIELQEKYVELKDYVDNYFENLDVQTEIDNKLDEMAEQGELAEIIAAYLEVASVLGFDTKADLKDADNLISGSIVRTLGDTTYMDGKGQFYKVRDLVEGDVIDDDLLVGLTNYPTLVAERIPSTTNSYDNLSSLLADDLLKANTVVSIAGYYNACDGGDSSYFVRAKGLSETANNITTYETNNGLIAEICDNSRELHVKKYGVKCDSVSNDAVRLQALINYAYNTGKEIVLDGYAYVASTIDTKGVKIRGIGKPIHPVYYYVSKTYGNIGFDYLKNQNNGALISFADYVNDQLQTGSGIISDTANPIVTVVYPNRFHLENLTVCGWLRNASQVGIKNTYDENNAPNYMYGAHRLKDVSVINCGSHGIMLTNLEMTTLTNVFSMLNFGYGIYLTGHETISTPTEYSKLEGCRLCGNKLGGFFVNKCFNKDLTFEKCEFTSSGLYNELGITPPDDNDDVVSGITINDYNSNQRNLIVNNCYGENLNEFIKIETSTGSHVFNNITITNNVMYPINSNGCLFYFNNYYSSDMVFHNNFINGGDYFVNGYENNNIIPFDCDQRILNNIDLVPTPTYNNKLSMDRTIIQRYGNLVVVNITATATSAITSGSELIDGYPKPIDNIHMLLKINNDIYYQTWWTNRKCSAPRNIAEGESLSWIGSYYVEPFSDKSGS